MEIREPPPVATGAPPRCLKDAVDMSDQDIEFLYGLAYNFYTHGRHGEAERVFAVLALCDPAQPRFWMGLGACRQKLGRYNEALAAYGRALDPNDKDYRAALHVAECLFELHWYNAACSVLDIAQRKLGDGADRGLGEERIAALRRRAEQAKRDAEKEQPTEPTRETAAAR